MPLAAAAALNSSRKVFGSVISRRWSPRLGLGSGKGVALAALVAGPSSSPIMAIALSARFSARFSELDEFCGIFLPYGLDGLYLEFFRKGAWSVGFWQEVLLLQ
jgi:hypothetical protein